MKLIVVRPEYELTTRYISAWADEIIDFAEEKKIEVVNLDKEKATRKEFEGRLKKLKETRLIFINGHGGEDCILGQDHQILLKEDDNDDLLAGKITYALSCQSAKKLGQKVSKYEKTVYIGYVDEFIFLLDSRYASKPLLDPKAKPFMEASNQVMRSLLKGNTAKESSMKSKNRFWTNFIKLASSAADPDSLQAMQFLRWDRMHQVCLGDKKAKINLS
jgi:hypothetical protein